MAITKVTRTLLSTGIDDQSNATAITIDSSENVGIGLASPSAVLETFGGTSFVGAKFKGYSGGKTALIGGDLDAVWFGDDDGSIGGTNSFNILGASNVARIVTNSIERMRIDSSGNLLVGKTATGIATVGAELKPTGELLATVSGDACAFLNRKTSDGDIINFRKDGSTVGSIGVYSSDRLFIGAGDTNITFKPSDDILYPSTSTGFARDATISFGDSGARFKDLYLSGGAYLGGTGSANHLDDYEEGTWTPTFSGASLSTATGFYTKIGDQVTVHYHIVTTGGLPSSTSQVRINDLPFSSAGNNVGAGSQYVTYYNVSNSSLGSIVQSSNNYIRFININTGSFDYLLMGELEVTSNNSITLIGTFTYRT